MNAFDFDTAGTELLAKVIDRRRNTTVFSNEKWYTVALDSRRFVYKEALKIIAERTTGEFVINESFVKFLKEEDAILFSLSFKQ